MSNSHCAHAGASFTDIALTRFTALASAMWLATRHWYRRRVTVQRLSELDDRMLSDIGLGRSEIGHVADRAATDRDRFINFDRR